MHIISRDGKFFLFVNLVYRKYSTDGTHYVQAFRFGDNKYNVLVEIKQISMVKAFASDIYLHLTGVRPSPVTVSPCMLWYDDAGSPRKRRKKKQMKNTIKRKQIKCHQEHVPFFLPVGLRLKTQMHTICFSWKRIHTPFPQIRTSFTN